MMGFTNYFLDKFVAPDLSQLTAVRLVDMSGRARPWVQDFLLNTFRVTVQDPFYQYFYTLLRRVTGAFYCYDLARADAIDYVSGDRNRFSKYMRALVHLEMFIANAW